MTVRSRLARGMLFQFAAAGAFWPYLTMYFLDHGMSYVQAGQIHAVLAVFQATAPLLWGMLVDRWIPANRMVIFLHVAATVSILFLAFQETFWGLLIGTALWAAFGSAVFPIYNAFSYHNLKSIREEFGALRLWGSIGWMLPSIPLWLWLHEGRDLQFIFFLAVAFEACFLLVAPSLPHTPPSVEQARARGGREESPSFTRALLVLLRRPGFLVLLVVVFLMFWSFSVLFYYSPVYLEKRGVDRQWYGFVQCIGVVVEIPFFYLLRRFLNRLGYLGTLALGCFFMLLRQCIFAFVATPWMLVSSSALVGLAVVFYLVTVSLTADALTRREVRATGQALLFLAGPGLGNLIGHISSGWLAERNQDNLEIVFLMASVVTALAILLLPLVAYWERRSLTDGLGLQRDKEPGAGTGTGTEKR